MPTTNISWQNLTNAVINGDGDLEKDAGANNCATNASGTGDGGARSVQTISAGNWEFRCTLGPDPSGRTFVGISRGSLSLDFSTWDYCIHVSTESNTSGTPHPANSIFIYEGSPPNKTYRDGIWDEGKLLRIVCLNNVVRYYLDSLLIYTSSKAPIYPCYVVASLACLNKTVVDPQLITGQAAGAQPCSVGSQKTVVEACGQPWTIPTPDPLPLPANGGPRPSLFQEVEGDWGEFGQAFGDGKPAHNTIQTAPVRRWLVEWPCDEAEAAILDGHYDSTRGALSFEFTDPYSGETVTGVRYDDYSRPPHTRRWEQLRSATLIKYPA